MQQLYSLLGAKDNVQIKPFLQFDHNFNYVSRGAMYEWMNKQLKLGVNEPVVEEDFVPLSRQSLASGTTSIPSQPAVTITNAVYCEL